MSTSTAPKSSGFYVCYKNWRLPAEEARQRRTARSIALLAKAYECREGDEHPVCTCRGEPGLELEEKKRERGKPFLARRKGQAHATGCPFSLPSHGGTVERMKAVKLVGGGLSFEVKVRLEPKESDASAPPDSMSDPVGAPSTTRSKVELTGMLWGMFEHRGFDTHHLGAVRTHSSVMNSLRELADNSVLNGRAMSKFAHFATKGDATQVWAKHMAALKNKKPGQQRRHIVVGEISSLVRPTKDGAAVGIYGVDAPFNLTPAIAAEVASQYRPAWRRALARNMHTESRVLAILVVAYNATGGIEVLRCCLCLMSSQYIICDSFLEVCVANKLVKLDRVFKKPLSFAPGETYLPDFELLDTHCRWILEVWGRDDMKYLDQKAKKIRYWLKEIGVRLWQWAPRKSWEKIRCFPRRAIPTKSAEMSAPQLQLMFS